MMNILVIHGPNLNLLGIREPNIYGHESQSDLFSFVESSFPNITFSFFQSNHEGEIIDKLHQTMQFDINDNSIDGIIINPGAFSHYSYAIHDAILSIKIPVATGMTEGGILSLAMRSINLSIASWAATPRRPRMCSLVAEITLASRVRIVAIVCQDTLSSFCIARILVPSANLWTHW